MTELLSEIIELPLGTADGCTICYMMNVRGPIHPGSVVVREVNSSVVDQLAVVSNPVACVSSGHDILGDGILYGSLNF